MHFRWHTRTLPVSEFGNATRGWTEREGILVVAQSTDGEYGLGEATPLPGYSPDSVVDVQSWLKALADFRLDLDAKLSFEHLLQALDDLPSPAPPSALLAIQSACLDWWCKKRGTALGDELWSVWHRTSDAQQPKALSNPMPPERALRVAPLLDCQSPRVVETALRLLSEGYTTYKVKIGRDLRHELTVLQELSACGRQRNVELAFRLDANQSLDAQTLHETLGAFATLPIEYVEEPCPIDDLQPQTPLALRLALDESLQRGPDQLASWLRPGRLGALVCKPMILGDLRSVLEWRTRAHTAACNFVLSHLFDGMVAHRLYTILACVLAPDICHGLFPHLAQGLWAGYVTESRTAGLGLKLTHQGMTELDMSREVVA